MAAATRDVGEFVAIGCPSDFVTPDGAKRIYVGDDSWQQKVLDLLRSAGAVVMVSGTTEGVAWEKQRIRECVDPRRLLLILPPAGPRERRQMAELSSRYLGTTVDLPPASRDDGGPLFYAFSADWQAAPLPRRDQRAGTRLLGFELFPRVVDFGRTLLPFLERLPARSLARARRVSRG